MDSTLFHVTRVLSACLFLCLGVLLVGPAHATDPTSARDAFEQGTRFFQQGAFEDAALSWMGAARGFETEGAVHEQVTALVHLAQALQSVGRYTQAVTTLDVALGLAEELGDRTHTATILGRLGQTAFSLGELKEALQYLNDAFVFAHIDKNVPLLAGLLNDRGRVLVAQKQLPDALASFTNSIQHARAIGDDALVVTAGINRGMAQLEVDDFDAAYLGFNEASDVVSRLPETHDKAYALISIGRHLNILRRHLHWANEPLLRRAVESLMTAAEIAGRFGDVRAQSYALGELGYLYEMADRRDEALHLTRQAILAAQQVDAPESLYRWEWQTARLLREQGKSDEALLAYRRAIAILQPIRLELTTSYVSEQGTFRESVGPLFFELTDMLLQRAGSLTDPQQHSAVLIQARNVVEEFKSAELQDYFRDDCVQTTRANITPLESVAESTAVVYPIMLPDRLELLVGFPDGLKRFSVQVSAHRLTQEIRTFRQLLENGRRTNTFAPHNSCTTGSFDPSSRIYPLMVSTPWCLFPTVHCERFRWRHCTMGHSS